MYTEKVQWFGESARTTQHTCVILAGPKPGMNASSTHSFRGDGSPSLGEVERSGLPSSEEEPLTTDLVEVVFGVEPAAVMSRER